MANQVYCIVDASGKVINGISYNGDQVNNPYTPPAGTTLQFDPAQQAGMGWTYAGGVFSAPVVNE